MLLTAMSCQFRRVVRILLVALLTVLLYSAYPVDWQATPTDDVIGPRDRSIDAVERHCFRFDVGGRMFDEGGRGQQVGLLYGVELFHFRELKPTVLEAIS